MRRRLPSLTLHRQSPARVSKQDTLDGVVLFSTLASHPSYELHPILFGWSFSYRVFLASHFIFDPPPFPTGTCHFLTMVTRDRGL